MCVSRKIASCPETFELVAQPREMRVRWMNDVDVRQR